MVVAPDAVPTPARTPDDGTARAAASRTAGDIELDYVGSVRNAARVIAALRAGEKRLVFCDSRQLVEELGAALRERGVTTFLSHASLAADERRRAEQAFAEARDCVILSTSTLELGVDVGDLDRVIQVNDPPMVAAFLQRIGRSGRRPGSRRNCLFLALDRDSLLWSAGLLHLWGTGYVEPVVPPPEPRHIVARRYAQLASDERLSARDRARARLWVGTALAKDGDHEYAARAMAGAARRFEELGEAQDWSVAQQNSRSPTGAPVTSARPSTSSVSPCPTARTEPPCSR